MDCKHERIRCTNNEFFCLLCGKQLPWQNPFIGCKEFTIPPVKVDEQKKPVKRKSKKEAEKHGSDSD
ncbi:MAG: hypothetical protein II010_03610 [Oscillospiraceae bacterium]|nr:hypothetical protein [Oscillospiraceae bacterium]